MDQGTILDRIVAVKREEIARARQERPLAELEALLPSAPPVRPFRAALQRADGLAVIAEVKKASPSAGVIRAGFDPVAIASAYAAAGADAISVLTDGPHFQGSLDYLTAIRAAEAPPVLRKDFLLDPYQVVEARVAGADAVLLIAEILNPPLLRDLLQLTRALGMEALVELYDRENLPWVLEAGADPIGVNNRDLRTFEVRLEHSLEIAELVPDEICFVSESGIRTRDDMTRLRQAGIDAVLIGETLMRAPDPGQALRDLR